MDTITDYVTVELIVGIVGLIAVSIAGKLGIDFISEIQKIFDTIKGAVSEDSEKGASLSKGEKDKIKNDLFDLVLQVYKKYRKGISGKVIKLFSKIKFWGS